MSKGANRGEVAELKGDDKKGRQKIDGKLLPFGGGLNQACAGTGHRDGRGHIVVKDYEVVIGPHGGEAIH